ncbi:hypothetical protein ACFX13_028707 [Malus domestica]
MADGTVHLWYVKLTKEQAPAEDINPGELNQPIEVPQVACGMIKEKQGGMAPAALTAIFHGIDPRTSFLICEGLLFSWWMCGIYTGLVRQSLRKKYHLKKSPCDPCLTHCCLHWCALCQEHREMKGRLADNAVMPMTVVNPPQVQQMKSADNNQDSAALSSTSNIGHTNMEMQAL